MDPFGSGTVQHVTKKSSDELLRKFSESGPDSGAGRRVLRRRKRAGENADRCDGGVDRRWLIPPAGRKSVVLKKLGIGRSQQLKLRDFRSKSVLRILEKTWRRTVEGTSKALLEKHYNVHTRLISDVV